MTETPVPEETPVAPRNFAEEMADPDIWYTYHSMGYDSVGLDERASITDMHQAVKAMFEHYGYVVLNIKGVTKSINLINTQDAPSKEEVHENTDKVVDLFFPGAHNMRVLLQKN